MTIHVIATFNFQPSESDLRRLHVALVQAITNVYRKAHVTTDDMVWLDGRVDASPTEHGKTSSKTCELEIDFPISPKEGLSRQGVVDVQTIMNEISRALWLAYFYLDDTLSSFKTTAHLIITTDPVEGSEKGELFRLSRKTPLIKVVDNIIAAVQINERPPEGTADN